MAEWDEFKHSINLVDYAQHTAGYYVDEKDSTPRGNPTNWVLRRESDDAKLLMRHSGVCWIYRDTRDPDNRGTVIDFVQHEKGFAKGSGTPGFGHVLRELRAYQGGASTAHPPRVAPSRPLRSSQVDRTAVARDWGAAKVVNAPRYLINRLIDPDILATPRFAGTFRVDDRSNVVFPNYDERGLLGLDKRNTDFKIQWPPGDSKGLWLSNTTPDDDALVVTESPIEALSYATIFNVDALYVSTGGAMSKAGTALLASILLKMPQGAQVVLGFNNDDAGNSLAALVQALVPPSLRVRKHLPSAAKDWNDMLAAAGKDAGIDV